MLLYSANGTLALPGRRWLLMRGLLCARISWFGHVLVRSTKKICFVCLRARTRSGRHAVARKRRTKPVMSSVSNLDEMRKRTVLFLGGGGFKSVGFTGVLRVLGTSQFKTIAGTSAGAFIALMLAVGYNPEEIAETCCRQESLLWDNVSLHRIG